VLGLTVNRFRLIVGWMAVSCATVLSCIWAAWGIIENFHEGWWGPTLWQNLGMMVMYLAPMTAFIVIALTSVRWPLVGSGLHIAASLFAFWFFSGGAAHHLIALPLALLGVSYWIGRPEPRKWAYAVIVTLPLVVLVACGAGPAWRVSRRLDDGNRDARLVQGNGVQLLWAPAGPGWPVDGVTWYEAQRRCRFLSADGRSLAETPQEIWRLPTAHEAIASLCRRGHHAGGVWDAATGKARFQVMPDKESPLWDTSSQVIYWWTATEVDPEHALRVSFNGFVNPLPKEFRPGYLAFRAVRDPDAPSVMPPHRDDSTAKAHDDKLRMSPPR
jgi:hypothetical protein